MHIVKFGGYVTYHPENEHLLTPELRGKLRQALIKSGLVSEPENPTFPASWRLNNADGPPYTIREVVYLYRDGGDAEEPAVLFYRTHGRPIGSIYIPPKDWQRAFVDATDGFWDSPELTAAKQAVLQGYLNAVLNTPELWVPLGE